VKLSPTPVSPSPASSDSVLLRCTTRPLFLWLWIVAGAGLLCWTIPQLFAWHGLADYFRMAALSLFGALLLLVGLKQAYRPTTMFEVTAQGIGIHRGGGMWLRADVFVPWERILAMRYLTPDHPDMTIRRTGFGGWRRSSVIGLKILIDPSWPPPRTRNDRSWIEIKDEIYLDSESGTPNGLALFRTLEDLRERFSRR
jgi:hypothetical protein